MVTVPQMHSLPTGIEQEYRRRTPRSAALHDEVRVHMPGGDTRSATYYPPYPTFIQSGSECHVIDVDGNRYLDLLNNYTSLIHGHAHLKTTEALTEQLRSGSCYASPTELQINLARRLQERISSM